MRFLGVALFIAAWAQLLSAAPEKVLTCLSYKQDAKVLDTKVKSFTEFLETDGPVSKPLNLSSPLNSSVLGSLSNVYIDLFGPIGYNNTDDLVFYNHYNWKFRLSGSMRLQTNYSLPPGLGSFFRQFGSNFSETIPISIELNSTLVPAGFLCFPGQFFNKTRFNTTNVHISIEELVIENLELINLSNYSYSAWKLTTMMLLFVAIASFFIKTIMKIRFLVFYGLLVPLIAIAELFLLIVFEPQYIVSTTMYLLKVVAYVCSKFCAFIIKRSIIDLFYDPAIHPNYKKSTVPMRYFSMENLVKERYIPAYPPQ
jgi:hypothetical protein